jgi:hypothetical protein
VGSILERFVMFFGFDSGWMKTGIGLVLSMIILLCTNVSTPLCQLFLSSMAFDEIFLIKALMVSVLLCVLLLSFFWAKLYVSPLKQIKKVLRWQATLRNLEESRFSLKRKIRVLNRLVYAMRSDLDLLAHYPETEYRKIRTVDDYNSTFEVLKRVLDVYGKTLSDEYYKSRYFLIRSTVY